jgi:shikimate kinase
MIGADQHVVLVGLMGSGKTTVGRALAERLRRPLLDTDTVVEQRAGRTIREIFADDGEPVFRDLESAALADVLAGAEPTVIATGGGVVLRAENRAALDAAEARVVWLSAEPGTLLERLRHATDRPLLDHDPEATLQRMADERAPLYREVADLVVRVDGRSLHEIVEAVLR